LFELRHEIRQRAGAAGDRAFAHQLGDRFGAALVSEYCVAAAQPAT
jgi:hypothetical protein